VNFHALSLRLVELLRAMSSSRTTPRPHPVKNVL
jgi:hypothetical protein